MWTALRAARALAQIAVAAHIAGRSLRKLVNLLAIGDGFTSCRDSRGSQKTRKCERVLRLFAIATAAIPLETYLERVTMGVMTLNRRARSAALLLAAAGGAARAHDLPGQRGAPIGNLGHAAPAMSRCR
jgi:hypothetical protein